MKCVICKLGETRSSHATFTLARDARVVAFKNVPAMVCENCGESYFTSKVTSRVLSSAEKTIPVEGGFESHREAQIAESIKALAALQSQGGARLSRSEILRLKDDGRKW
ncbi:MAG: type II toxin-antitoxin system MqsA family antitoxin [Cytophagales bacterium]|nr:type II toxin-antitoxin system MqsA family antitoxin [Cytophagales bacterium]